MRIEVSSDDIASALSYATKLGREHNVYNPLAIAFARVYCNSGVYGESGAVVTMDYVHVASRALTGSFKLTDAGRDFMRSWRSGYCKPTPSLIACSR